MQGELKAVADVWVDEVNRLFEEIYGIDLLDVAGKELERNGNELAKCTEKYKELISVKLYPNLQDNFSIEDTISYEKPVQKGNYTFVTAYLNMNSAGRRWSIHIKRNVTVVELANYMLISATGLLAFFRNRLSDRRDTVIFDGKTVRTTKPVGDFLQKVVNTIQEHDPSMDTGYVYKTKLKEQNRRLHKTGEEMVREALNFGCFSSEDFHDDEPMMPKKYLLHRLAVMMKINNNVPVYFGPQYIIGTIEDTTKNFLREVLKSASIRTVFGYNDEVKFLKLEFGKKNSSMTVPIMTVLRENVL